jgi:hypothetical protein
VDSATGLDPRKKKMVIAGAGVVALGGFWWYRRQTAAAAAAAAPAGTSGADTAALGLDSAVGPGVYGAQGTAASSSTVGAAPTTNQDWYAAALAGAEDAGYDSGTAATALSAYLAHQPLTPAQQTVVRIGLGAAGNPPSGTFTIVTAPPTSNPGQPAAPAGPPPVPGGLRVANLTATGADFTWNGVPGAYKYHLYIGNQLVSSGPETFGGDHQLLKNTHYGPVTVASVSADSAESARSAPLYITTKAK